MSEPATATTVQVYLGPRSYEIVIDTAATASFEQHLRTWLEERERSGLVGGRAFLVTDGNVTPHATAIRKSLESQGWTVGGATLEPGERSKCLETAARCYDELVELKADRNTVVVAVGGGVVGDLAGFVAATYGRGVPFVQVPTTLLADVDSSVGGKVGINLSKAKNLVGAFHQPLGVFIDTSVLDTLPDREFRCGLAEIVKYGVILDGGFFDFLEKHVDDVNARKPDVLRAVIARCCRLKADIVERDEYERLGLRSVLNYGHTFAHAYEALTGYDDLRHGEAVAVGMVRASQLAERRDLVKPDVTARQIELLHAFGLATELPENVDLSADDVLDRMRLDKKNVGGRIRFVLPTRIGHVRTYDDVPEEDVRAVLAG